MPSFPLIPAAHQPAFPLERVVLAERPSPDAISLDVLFVGAGPAGLAGAIELAKLVAKASREGGGLGSVEIGVLEKAERLGDHSLSGAVVNPRGFRELFPGLSDGEFPFRSPVKRERVYLLTRSRAVPVPTPPTMRNRGYYIASLCEIVRWLGQRAEALGVNLFPGFPAASLLVEGSRVVGVRTAPAGLDREGKPLPGYTPATDVVAKVVVLAEGSRGMLTEGYLRWQGISSRNPQIYALGVKELWETKRPLDCVVHTMGWPLDRDTFGGSFMYPLEPNLIALGLVVGLDSPDASLDVHFLLQRMKTHPFFRSYLEGGQMVEWGAKTIPEGGYYSLPQRRYGDGVIILGDAAGLVNVAALKGIHYAMYSGIFAARAIFRALKAGDTSAAQLAEYDRLLEASFVMRDLYRTRNMRSAFKDGFYAGALKAGLMSLSGGRFPGGRIEIESDAERPRTRASNIGLTPDGQLTFSKVDAVYRSGNVTRDTIPQHLVLADRIPESLGRLYAHLCPAGVYEWADGKLRVNSPNCVDCKATDVLGPRWTPREGGSGPKYQRM